MRLPLFPNPIYKKLNIVSIVLAVVLLILALLKSIPLYFSILPALLWSTIVVWGAFKINSGVFIKSINNINTAKKVIALTFDDGPHENTGKILEILGQYNAKATFFFIGEKIEQYPDITKAVHEKGHQIGNHTYSHSNKFPMFGLNKMTEELAKTSILIKKVTGIQPKIFRPPFGITNPRVAKVCRKTNLDVIGWSVRSLDTVIKDPQKIKSRIISGGQPGSIVLLHDYTDFSLNYLEKVLSYYSENKYKFVTINKLLEYTE